jgi:hypothetical protein
MAKAELINVKSHKYSAEGQCSSCGAFFSVSENQLAPEELNRRFHEHVRESHSREDAARSSDTLALIVKHDTNQ